GRARHVGLTAQAPLGADLARDGRHLLGEDREGVGHSVDGVGELCNLAFRLQGQLAFQIAVGDRGDHACDAAHLVGQVAGHRVDVVCQVLPGSADTLDVGLSAQTAVGAYLTRHARHLFCESVQLVDHGVDRLLELEDLAPDIHRDLLRQVALLDRGGDLGNVADLAGQVAGHEVHVFSQVFPTPPSAPHVGLAA